MDSKHSPFGIARELLRLEARGKSEWDIQQTERWMGLTTALLDQMRVQGEQRRNIRLPSHAAFRLGWREETYDCTVVDVSHTGARVELIGLNAVVGDLVVLKRPTSPERRGLPARIVCISKKKGGTLVVGVRFFQTERGAREDYFEKVYYPAYVNYLSSLSNHAMA